MSIFKPATQPTHQSILHVLFCLTFFVVLSLINVELAIAGSEKEFTVSFQGIDAKDLLQDLKKSSVLLKKKEQTAFSAFFLKKQAESDLARLRETCFAHGYYQAEAELQVVTADENHFEVLYTFNLGPLYQIRDIEINSEPDQDRLELKFPDPQELNILPGTPAQAERILGAKTKLLQIVRSQGYLDARQEKPEVIVDEASPSVKIVFHLFPGPMARLGPTRIIGLEKVEEPFVSGKIPWTSGQIYDPDQVYRFKTKLMQTGLFNLVNIEIADQANQKGLRPVTVQIRERAQRTVRFGLGYETDIGPLAHAEWTHNNYLGRGEKLSVRTDLSLKEQEIFGQFTKPHFMRADQSLLLRSSLLLEDYESYENTAFSSQIRLQREVNPELKLNFGAGYKLQSTTDSEGTEQFNLLFFPGYLQWDTRDDLLHPTQGLNIGFGFTPFQSLFPGDLTFFKTVLSARWYQALDPEKNFILALRSKLGSISGAATASIPADERFYAGGGGSVRGYPYQEVSLRKNNDPYGGRSLLEVSSELRWKISDPFGLVLFIDGGQVTANSLPDLDQDLSWGAGLGLRYFTDLGPLRLDIAFPLNPEDSIDESFQVYISIGQAF